MYLFLISLNILQLAREISTGSGIVYFLKVAALSLSLLSLKSRVATATRYSVSVVAALLPTFEFNVRASNHLRQFKRQCFTVAMLV